MKTILLSASIYGLMAAVCMRPEDGSGQGGGSAGGPSPASASTLTQADGSTIREYKGPVDPEKAGQDGPGEDPGGQGKAAEQGTVGEFIVKDGQIQVGDGTLADGHYRRVDNAAA